MPTVTLEQPWCRNALAIPIPLCIRDKVFRGVTQEKIHSLKGNLPEQCCIIALRYIDGDENNHLIIIDGAAVSVALASHTAEEPFTRVNLLIASFPFILPRVKNCCEQS
jgi:hypothetical protein